MIGYICKYTPVELLCALGAKPELLNGEVRGFAYAEGLTHANLCCQAKALLEHSKAVSELIMVSCCDSVRRVHDVLLARGEHRFLFVLDLPHDDNNCARQRLQGELLRLTETYSSVHNTSFDFNLFQEACQAAEAAPVTDKPFLAVLGARVSRELLSSMQEQAAYPLIDLTCGGHRRLEPLPPDVETLDFAALMDWYAGALLGLVPCLRMTNVAGRRSLWETENLRGIIYNTVKFCDYYGFDYAMLKKETRLPVLKIESDFTPQSGGQLSTRLAAFVESLSATPAGRSRRKNGQGRLVAGIDSGSTTTNMVALNQKREIVAAVTVRTGAKAQKGAEAALAQICRQLGTDRDDFAAIVATGYGRGSIPFATATKTEITCHARGAYFLNPGVRTIVDIGGQDSKVIRIDENGVVINFIMNDKCSAGTGLFLEMMARTLELELEEMSTAGLDWKRDLTIASMCTVFAESEVISLIADNHSTADIVHGLNKSVAAKTASMVSRAGGRAPYMMTGGVARNQGVVRELARKLGEELFIPEAPELCGALGAALLALELTEKA